MNGVPYSGNLSREKTFTNFTVLWLFAKVFSAKFGARHPLAQQNQAIGKSFLCENQIFHQFTKVFSLESFPLYGILYLHTKTKHIFFRMCTVYMYKIIAAAVNNGVDLWVSTFYTVELV